jgi:uncharacterized protein (TIGR02118 family)
MVKVIVLLKKKDGLTQEAFSQYWRQKHGVLVTKTVPGLKRYVQNHVMKLPGGRPFTDGVAELWYDDMESWQKSAKWYLGDKGKIIRDDEDNFIDKSKMVFIVAEEDEVYKE